MKTNLFFRGAFWLFCLFFLQITNSQVQEPKITPMTPESASLGRYGNVALTGATGQMNYSVPIYNIEVDGNSWPISLNYNYGGLILEGKPSLWGLGWNLSAYANITKETRGLPDGHPSGYYGDPNLKAKIDTAVNDYLDDGQFQQISFIDLRNFRDGAWDSEVDKYTLNLGGQRISFKIYRDTNDNDKAKAHFLSRHNYKIEITEDNTKDFSMASFEVTDEKGIKYFFDADNREKVVSDPYTEYAQDPTTSWLLSEIRYTNDQSIVFDYYDDSDKDYYSYDFVAIGWENDLDTSTQGQNPTNVPGAVNWSMGYSDQINLSHIERQLLKSITFPQGSLHFSKTTVDTPPRVLYDKIELKDHDSQLVSTFNLSYTGERDALTNITKNGENYFGFEYYGIHTNGYIPPFIDSQNLSNAPYDQDYWKYYNQAGNQRAIHLPFQVELANKQPNLSATRLGALKRIIYPTRGYTEIEYEQNQEKQPYIENPAANEQSGSYNDELFVTVDAHVNNNQRFASITKTFDYPVRASLYHKIKGNLIHGNSIYLTIEKISGPPDEDYYSHGDPPNVCNYYYQPPNQTPQPYYPIDIDIAKTNLIEDECNPYYPYPIIRPRLVIDHDPDNNCVWYGSAPGSFGDTMGCVSETHIDHLDDSGGDFFIVPGTYKFTIDVRHLYYDDLFAEIGLRWFDPTEGTGVLPDFVNANVGGIRVKKIIDFSDDGVHTNVKHFDYNDSDGFSTARVNQRPYFKHEHIWEHYDNNHTPTYWIQKFDEYLAGAYTALDINQGIPVYYSEIKTHNSVDLHDYSTSSNGYTIQKFSLPQEDLASDTYPNTPRLEDVTKALPLETIVKNNLDIVVSSNDQLYQEFRHQFSVINNESTDYDISNDHPWSFKYFKKLVNEVDWNSGHFDNPNPTPYSDEDYALKSLHDMKPYKEVDLKRLLIDETSLSQGVSQSTTYNYDSNLFLQSIVSHDSQGNETKVEYDYPYEVNETQYNNMSNSNTLNQVAIPIAQRTYLNNELISQQKTNFVAFGNHNLYRPKEILTAKDSEPLTKEIEFLYNGVGQIKEYKRNNGNSPSTSIIYGYDETVPVAKIENATYSQAVAELNEAYSTMQSQDGSILRNNLDGVRQGLPDAQVTTYTYNPLIGVESITDPSGETIHYTYDPINRLQYIKDENLDVLEEYRYNYRVEELNATMSSSATTVPYNTLMTFDVVVTGGTGNFDYSWNISNANLNENPTNNTSTHTLWTNSNHDPSFTISCVVTDTQTNETITVNRIINVDNTPPSMNVGNISVSPSGSKSVGDNITYTISATGGSGVYSYHWEKIDSNSVTTDYGTSSSNTLVKAIVSLDCNQFTIKCTVTDVNDSQSQILKQVQVNVDNGCSGGNQ